MSGHSKWSTIKRKKEKTDNQRAKIFTKIGREISVAVKEGGPDPSVNTKLKDVIAKAKSNNVPNDNIERIIKKAAGEGNADNYEEIMYEGYGPKGVALMIECVTENRNRTVADIRHALSRAGGNLGESGSVAWQFSRKAYFLLEECSMDFDSLFELALEAGADDIEQGEDGSVEITAEPDMYKSLADALAKAGLHIAEAELKMIPNQEMELSKEDTMQVLRVVDALDEMDDTEHVYHNMAVSDEIYEAMEE